MRLNHRGLGTEGSQSRVVVAIALLILFGAAALALGCGAVRLRTLGGDANNRPQVPVSKPAPSAPEAPRILAAYRNLPLIFEPNRGQSDPKVRFLARGSGYALYLTSGQAVLGLQQSALSTRHSAPQVSWLRMGLVGASTKVSVTGSDQLPGKSNYFIGNDPAKWHRDIPQFARVRYHNVYPGIDLIYYGRQGQLEYDFEVAPGSDPKQVALRFEGSRALKTDANGDLVLTLSGGDVRLQAPRVYQKFGQEERPVAGHFELRSNHEVGFALGAYDRSRAVIIDPLLTYSRYLGGSGAESCSAITGLNFTPGCPAIAVDAVGNAYIAGSTTSTNFPVTSGAYQGTFVTGATANVFVAKLNPSASIVFATYLGGEVLDYSAGIAVDNAANVYVAGTTTSTKFPTMNGFQSTPLNPGKNHVFVSKLDAAGAHLLYSTYLSGSGIDIASGVAVDPGGRTYVTGTTTSTEVETGFPSTLGAIQISNRAPATNQFFFTKLDPTMTGSLSLLYSTYLGGSSPTTGVVEGGGIAVDSNSNAYITGGTDFADMPLANAYQSAAPVGKDVYVAKINPAAASGAQLIYATYLGGSGDDIGYGIAVDKNFFAYVAGSTTSTTLTDFHFTPPSGVTVFQANNAGARDAFIAKLGVPCTGTSCTTTSVPFTYFSYLGGTADDVGTAIAVDSNQGARLTGWTDSANFPSVNNPVQPGPGGGIDAFVARIDTTATTNTALGHYSTYLGGAGTDMGTGIAVDTQGASYVTGETNSTPFPGASGSVDGPSDAFVSKLGPLLNLGVAGTGSPSPVGVGNQVTFTYTITNDGDFTNGVTFTDILPSTQAATLAGTPTANPGSCGAPSGGNVLCNIGSLNSSGTATVTVNLIPTAAGALGNTGTINVTGTNYSNSPNPPPSVTVNDFSIAVAPATFTVAAGAAATYTVTLTPTGNIPQSVSVACGAGLPTGTTCTATTNPIPNLSNGKASTDLVINTTARVTTTTRLWRGGPLYAIWLPLSGLALLGVGIGRKASRQRRVLMGVLLGGVFSMVLFQAACGSKHSTTTTTGTPAGTYTVTVNATSGTNGVHSTVVTLVVQ